MLTRAQKLIGIGAAALIALILLVLGTQSLRASITYCGGLNCYLQHTTTNDFVRGEFYATGLRKLGDGEVQLLPVGLSTPWQSTTALPANRAELALVSNNNILYAIGGYDGNNYRTEIYSATTSLVGDITAGWTKTADLPAARAGAGAVVAHNPDPILYVVGGTDDTHTGGTDTIYYRKIGTNGSFSGNWNTVTGPINFVFSGAVVHGANLYVIGGTPNAINTIYRFPITNSNGDLGTPVEELVLPESLTRLGAVTWLDPAHDFLYVVGGQNGFGNASQNVYFTSFNADGSLDNSGPVSGWQNTSLVDAFNAHGTVQYNGAIYVIGGLKGIFATDAVTTVQTALIDPDGSLHNWGSIGNWIVTEPLPSPRYSHGSTVNDGGELFLAGGYDATGNAKANVYHGSTTGAASTYAPNGSYTSDVMDIGPNLHMTGIKWNAAVEDTSNNHMALAMYYRTSNDSTALLSQNWTLAGLSAQSTNGVTNTLTFPNKIDNRYLQYRAEFTTTISNKSPRLNAVEVDYQRDPTPTPTNTSTPTTGPSNTPTSTLTPTQTATPTATDIVGASPTPTNTPTFTPTATSTASPSPTSCNGKPGRETQLSPNKNANLFVREVPLAWAGVTCKQTSKVIVKYDNKKGAKAFKKKNIGDNTVTTKKLDKGRTYVWKVRSCNAKGCGKWSEWRSFKVSKNAK